MQLENIILDFDGVLVESLEVKKQAFYTLYESHGKFIANAVVDHHVAHGGMSRFQKLRTYHREHLGVELTDRQLEALAKRFSALVMGGVIAAPEVPGALDFLEHFYGKVQLLLITGTPTEEINQILMRKGWLRYFDHVLGSPTNKDFWVHHLVSKGIIDADRSVFIGDAGTDLSAARKHGIHFYLREHQENRALFPQFTGKRVRDFHELETVLRSDFGI